MQVSQAEDFRCSTRNFFSKVNWILNFSWFHPECYDDETFLGRSTFEMNFLRSILKSLNHVISSIDWRSFGMINEAKPKGMKTSREIDSSTFPEDSIGWCSARDEADDLLKELFQSWSPRYFSFRIMKYSCKAVRYQRVSQVILAQNDFSVFAKNWKTFRFVNYSSACKRTVKFQWKLQLMVLIIESRRADSFTSWTRPRYWILRWQLHNEALDLMSRRRNDPRKFSAFAARDFDEKRLGSCLKASRVRCWKSFFCRQTTSWADF